MSVGFVAALAIACATPSERYDAAAREGGFERRVIEAGAASLVVFEAPGRPEARRLHVYIEGDGLPRRAARHVPPDPTPPDPLMLRLMELDPAPALLLGRPCHHGTPCGPGGWTSARYGEAVVATMLEALGDHPTARGAAELVWIGFSGGGTLAMLLAEREPRTIAVVTLAGNLDVAAWTRHHGYPPLEDSLDPARRPPLADGVRQLHLSGGRDEEVPPVLLRRAIERQPRATWRVFPSFDHRCCWEQAWPGVLSEFPGR